MSDRTRPRRGNAAQNAALAVVSVTAAAAGYWLWTSYGRDAVNQYIGPDKGKRRADDDKKGGDEGIRGTRTILRAGQDVSENISETVNSVAKPLADTLDEGAVAAEKAHDIRSSGPSGSVAANRSWLTISSPRPPSRAVFAQVTPSYQVNLILPYSPTESESAFHVPQDLPSYLQEANNPLPGWDPRRILHSERVRGRIHLVRSLRPAIHIEQIVIGGRAPTELAESTASYDMVNSVAAESSTDLYQMVVRDLATFAGAILLVFTTAETEVDETRAEVIKNEVEKARAWVEAERASKKASGRTADVWVVEGWQEALKVLQSAR